MNIIRHSLTDSERGAIASIVARVHELAPDASATQSPPGVTTIHTTTERAGGRGHVLNRAACPAALRSLEGLRAAVARVADAGTPLIILERLPIEHNASALVLLVGSLLGEVREYSGHGAAVAEVSDKAVGTEDRPSSDNRLAFPCHTDMSFHPQPPAAVCFLLINDCAIGGESTFCDVVPLLERMPVDTIAGLRQRFRFPAPPHMPSLGVRHFPVLTFDRAGNPAVRYRRDRLEAPDAFRARALRVFEEETDAHTEKLRLRTGEMAVCSNTRLLHGRLEFRDEPRMGKVRCALRAYVDGLPG